jgi:hypothetical protein
MKKKYFLIGLPVVIISVLCCFFYFKKVPAKNHPFITDKKALNFEVIGDWGRRGHHLQKDVANEMAITSDSMGTDFFISTGDNFYPDGVTGIDDDAWKESYENVYSARSLQKNWYAVLGNHDYKGNIQAEIDYTKKSERWKMPAKYYAIKLPLKDDTTQRLLMIFLDTSPLISITGDDEEGDAGFLAVKRAYDEAQLRWLDSVLADPSPVIKWRIVCGHHPLFTGSKRANSPHTKELHNLLYPVFAGYKTFGSYALFYFWCRIRNYFHRAICRRW